MADIPGLVNPLSTAPENTEDFDKWIEQKDAVAFLRDNAKLNDIVVDLSATCAFIHTSTEV